MTKSFCQVSIPTKAGIIGVDTQGLQQRLPDGELNFGGSGCVHDVSLFLSGLTVKQL